MKQLMSLALSGQTLTEYPDWAEACRAAGCDGLEAIWGGEPLPADVPKTLRIGYHLTFFPDWLDFWLGDEVALRRKFGAPAVWQQFYGGINGRETLLAAYRADLERAVSWGAAYVVFHVSDVSVCEGYTYRWTHTHEQVLDAAAQVINLLLDGRDWPFAFLMENQWWPGLTLTNPAQTRRLLAAVHVRNKGLLLDTGHLMNANLNLKTQAEGVEYLHRMLDAHADMLPYIRGIHLHQSLSGEYVKTHTGALPPNWAAQGDYVKRFANSYGHVLKIDTHQPFTCPDIASVVARIAPDWLVHELSAPNRQTRSDRIRQQRETLNPATIGRQSPRQCTI